MQYVTICITRSGENSLHGGVKGGGVAPPPRAEAIKAPSARLTCSRWGPYRGKRSNSQKGSPQMYCREVTTFRVERFAETDSSVSGDPIYNLGSDGESPPGT